MEKFVMDTNFFLNMEIDSGFGKSAKEVIGNFTKLAQKTKQAKTAEFFMPPRIVAELTGFFENEALIKDFLTVITVKSPEVAKIQFPATVFYKLVEEIRERSYRGLRLAEEAVSQSGHKMAGQNNLNKIEFEKTIGEIVKSLREKYRQATRFNFLDSVADLDLIALTAELDGFLVSSDEGVIRWGRIFGVRELSAQIFRLRLMSRA